MSDSVRPHLWDSAGKNTGVDCHFLLQCIKVQSESEVAQPRPTLRDPMDCSLPGSSVHGIFQARVLVWCHCLLWQFSLQASKKVMPSCKFCILSPDGTNLQFLFYFPMEKIIIWQNEQVLLQMEVMKLCKIKS